VTRSSSCSVSASARLGRTPRRSPSRRADLTQPTGILHGGLQSILIDTAIAQALLTTLRPGFSVVTVRLDTNYFAPVRSGRVVVSAKVVRKGKRIVHGEAVVTDEHDAMVAQGWGVFAVVGPRTV
jgi:uncharacterized protein (TIGR00369 family)